METNEIHFDLLKDLKSETLKLNQLFLNPNNPRIIGKTRKKSIPIKRALEEKVQESILTEMKEEGLNDLIEKIVKVGFLPIDRVVVKPIEDSKYIVLEGNRRISSLRIITDEYTRGLRTIPNHLVKSLDKIEALIYTGSDLNIEWLLQGIRHINGVKEWGSLQQAKYLVEMKENKHLRPTELDQMTGLGRNSIANKIRSYKGWIQANEIYEGDVLEEHFSLFSEAIFARPAIKEWLKWNNETEKFQDEDNFTLILNWFIGDDKDKRRFTRALDVRDVMSKLLQKENIELLDKFLNDEECSVEEIKYELNQKSAEKDAMKKQLDAHTRLEEIDKISSIINTLPIKAITEDNGLLNKYILSLTKLISDTTFQKELLDRYASKE
jgi:hypothetical protein